MPKGLLLMVAGFSTARAVEFQDRQDTEQMRQRFRDALIAPIHRYQEKA